jgi:cyclohexanone monooxygenase
MPLLEETGYVPTEKYAKAPELQEHARRIGRHFGLYEKSIFHTEGRDIEWNEETSRWIIKTDRGDTFRAKFFATASGPLNMPKLPGVDGIEKYKGHYFHTSRWDYDYTGGTVLGNLDKIKDKKIGIIGTGATAIQAVPHLGAGAGQLYVFQRTPSSIGWRNNRPTDPEWAANLKPGWQAERQENFLRVMAADPFVAEDLVDDGWTAITKWMRQKGVRADDRQNLWLAHAKALEEADYETMEQIRRRCDDVVKNAQTAEGLKPWYRQLCKRPCFHDEYLETFNRPNVTLVHTDGKGIDNITEKGIVANGKEYEVDCIIYSTGFEVGTGYERRSNFIMKGRNGLTISDAWTEGPRTLHGFHCPDFPNMFLISTLQSGFAANFTHMLTRQGKWVADIVRKCQDRNIKTIEANKQAAERWTDAIVADQWMSATFQQECTPGYYNLEGQIQQNIVTKRAGESRTFEIEGEEMLTLL